MRRSAAIAPAIASSGTGDRSPESRASSARRAQLARPSSGNQATAMAGGRLTSTAASGTEAVSWPTPIIARSTSHAAPPTNQPATSPIGPSGAAVTMTPTTAVRALASMASGTSGTTRTFDSGATSDRRSKLTRMIGRVVSCAASVRATGSRSHAGHRARRASIDFPNQIRPAVASNDSWKPTSHNTDGAATNMSSAANPRAEVAWARDPARRPTSTAPAMSAARTTDGLAPVSIT